MEIGTKFRILSIDEEKEVQYYLKRMFIQKGYKFFAAQSGKDGITQITNGCPDLVLLDLILPDMDGMDIIKKVRSVSDCPMIVVSSKGKEKDKVSALDAGAEDFSEEEDSYEVITAPDDFSAVREALEALKIPMMEADVTMIPQTWVELSDEDDIKKLNRILDLLDEDDDVQAVYHNWDE